MAVHVKIKTHENNHVHFDYGRADYTLCGLDNLGDSRLGIGVPIKTNDKVDCPVCIDIVKYCNGIKKSEMKS